MAHHESPRPRLRPERERLEREQSPRERARRLREEGVPQLLEPVAEEAERQGLPFPGEDELAPLRQRPRRISKMVREKETRERIISRAAPGLKHAREEMRRAHDARIKELALRGMRALRRTKPALRRAA